MRNEAGEAAVGRVDPRGRAAPGDRRDVDAADATGALEARVRLAESRRLRVDRVSVTSLGLLAARPGAAMTVGASRIPRVAGSPMARRAAVWLGRLGGGSPVDPRWTCVGLLGLLASGLALGVPEAWLAGLLVAGHAILLLHSPVNGLVLLLLLPPFFAGESYRPYFFLLELFVYSTLAAWALFRWPRRPRLRAPGAPALVCLLAATAAALPLDLRELWLFLGTASPREVWQGLWQGQVHPGLNYGRVLLNLVSGIGLFLAAASEEWDEAFLRRLLEAIALLLAVTGVGALLLYAGYTSGWPGYVSLTLVASLGGAFVGFGYNQSYFAQYAVPYLALAAGPLFLSRRRWPRAVAAAALLAGVVGVSLTLQRGAYICLALVLLGLAVVPRWLGGFTPRRSLASAMILVTAGLGVAAALVLSPIGQHILPRALHLYDPVRVALWRVSFNMLGDHPFLGVGTGRFTRFFAEYSAIPPRSISWGTSHSLYAQLLAEQGLVGLLAFGWVVTRLVGYPLTALARRRARDGVVLLLLLAITVWLVYGLFQYTFYIRAMQLFFWLSLGVVAAIVPGPARVAPWARRTLIPALLVLTATGAAWRVTEAVRRPLPPDFEQGLYRWERQPDGELARWTQNVALLNLRVEGEVLLVQLAARFPSVETRPQRVTIRLDGRPATSLELADSHWVTVEVPVTKPRGSDLLLGLETSYAVVPSKQGWGRDDRRLGVMLRRVEWRAP